MSEQNHRSGNTPSRTAGNDETRQRARERLSARQQARHAQDTHRTQRTSSARYSDERRARTGAGTSSARTQRADKTAASSERTQRRARADRTSRVGQVRPQTFEPAADLSGQTAPERVLGLLSAALLGLIRLIMRGLQAVAGLFGKLMRANKAAGIAVAVVAVLLVGGLVDAGLNAGKIYPGVSIGGVDVSGMTEQQALQAVHEAYDERVSSGEVIIFANEETAASVDVEQQIVQDQARAEQISFEEAQKSKIIWVETAETLGASIPAEQYAHEAYEVGRTGIGLIDRIGAWAGGRNIETALAFDDEKVETLASDIDSSIGEPRQDFDIAIEEGEAHVVEGHDGSMVNRETLKSEITNNLLGEGESKGSFVAQVEYAPLRIDEQAAQKTCDAVNTIIAQGAAFTSHDEDLAVSREELGSWLSTRVEETGEGYALVPYVDASLATPSLVALVNGSSTSGESSVVVDITVEGDDVKVTPEGEVTVPELTEAISALDDSLFSAYREKGASERASNDAIHIETRTVSGELTFDEAFSYGIVTEVSSYTTQYTNTESTQNRNHNIHLVSDLLNNSVAEAQGGTWTFNTVAGNCNEEAGFLPAGAIAGDQYVDEAGGGICQVATTVFNAVYDAGYTVVSRSNHTLYMASYPAGRDAAVSYPDLDFVWRNDTNSDVLLRTSYTDTSVTITLYGVDPGYTVSTETGEWVEGEKHATRTEYDETLAPGTSYVKTVGTDGLEITVYRTVKAKDGTVVHEDAFYSVYSPITEVVVKGPEAKDDNASTSSGQIASSSTSGAASTTTGSSSTSSASSST